MMTVQRKAILNSDSFFLIDVLTVKKNLGTQGSVGNTFPTNPFITISLSAAGPVTVSGFRFGYTSQ